MQEINKIIVHRTILFDYKNMYTSKEFYIILVFIIVDNIFIHVTFNKNTYFRQILYNKIQ